MQIKIQVSKKREISTPPVIDIELLALDLNSCTRCVGTLDHIEKAIDIIRPVLEVMDAQVNVRKIVVESEEQARQYHFATSPTVRINGNDIAFETLESECDSCTDLCGCDEGTSCRVWRYRGGEYTESPVGLVVESILRQIFGSSRESVGETPAYRGVPENLRRFFRSKSDTRLATESCCSPVGQETCCEPSRRATCCDASQPETCGCH
ncbi:MAG: DUF2703 domain-containing protein [Gammaproteobacteria bacterium]|nr:DUF2703 domain-containing protein [Gammaproteobacteria bacterium]